MSPQKSDLIRSYSIKSGLPINIKVIQAWIVTKFAPRGASKRGFRRPVPEQGLPLCNLNKQWTSNLTCAPNGTVPRNLQQHSRGDFVSPERE